MKATLTFNLPDEENEHKQAVEGARWEAAMWTILERNLRPWLKYGHTFKTPTEALEAVRNKIIEELDRQNLSFGNHFSKR